MSLIELEKFIELGYYTQLRTLMKCADTLKGLIRAELEKQDIERYVWEELGIVVVRRYEYDSDGLKEHLLDLGILPIAVTIKNGLLSEEEIDVLKRRGIDKEHAKSQVRFFPKKLPHAAAPNMIMDTMKNSQSLYQSSTSDCVYLWREYKRLIDKLTKQWNTILMSIGRCSDKKIAHIKTNYGTVTIQREYNFSALDVLRLLGEEVLLRSSKINYGTLEEFAVRGFISKREINMYRQNTNICRQFILMERSKEQRSEAWLCSRRERLMRISASCLIAKDM